MIERRYRPGVAVLNGKIYVLGGEEGWDHYHDTIECYDPIADKWEIVSKTNQIKCLLKILIKCLLFYKTAAKHLIGFVEGLISCSILV